jgi:hypothetical protein
MTEADTQAYQQERFRLFRAQIEADLGITSEIERIRGVYVALFPVEPEARRAELEALKRELHLDDFDPTPGTKRRQAPKNRGPMEPLGSWLSRLPQSGAKLESAAAQPAALVWKRVGMHHRAEAGVGHYLVSPTETLDGGRFNVVHFSTDKVIAEERRDLGTAKSLKAAKAIAMSDWAKRGVISTDPLPVIKPTVLEWKSVTPDLEASFLFQRLLQ